MNQVYEQGIELLGFKSIESIKPYYHIKPANFLYPDEKSVQGRPRFLFYFIEFLHVLINLLKYFRCLLALLRFLCV